MLGAPGHAVAMTSEYYEDIRRSDFAPEHLYRYTYCNLRMPEYADKPILIGETTVGALDRGMLHPSLRPTQSQEQRAYACSHILESALDNPWIVGVHWFMYVDQVCTGSSFNARIFRWV